MPWGRHWRKATIATSTVTRATLTVVEYSITAWSTPSAKAAITAPRSWPMPPTTITRKASMMMLVPMVGPMGPTSVRATPARPARPEPMRKVIRSTRPVAIPDASARSRCCTTALIRRPSEVRRRVSVSATTAATARPRMNSRLCARVNECSPPTRVIRPLSQPGAWVCTLGAPKTSLASCWSIRETPQVTSRVSSGRV